MQINKSNNTSFKALYLPKSEQIAKFAQGDWFSTIKPELENLAWAVFFKVQRDHEKDPLMW